MNSNQSATSADRENVKLLYRMKSVITRALREKSAILFHIMLVSKAVVRVKQRFRASIVYILFTYYITRPIKTGILRTRNQLGALHKDISRSKADFRVITPNNKMITSSTNIFFPLCRSPYRTGIIKTSHQEDISTSKADSRVITRTTTTKKQGIFFITSTFGED